MSANHDHHHGHTHLKAGFLSGLGLGHRIEIIFTVICGVSITFGFLGSVFGIITDDVARYAYMIAYLTGGYFGVIESGQSLLRGKFNIDVLMVTAAAGAAVINQWLEGAILLFLFSLSHSLQHFAMDKSRNAIKSLMDLRPDEALKRNPDGSEDLVPIAELKIGDLIIVKPGNRIPIDGMVKSGAGTVNQAAITGESEPVMKEPGSDVFAATLNENGILIIEVTHLAGETTLAKIIKLVEQAQSEKAKTQRFLDAFESKYAVGVIIFTIALILIPWYILGHEFDPVFYRAMTVLVVASPCALIISTPSSILSAIANAAKKGILYKGGAYLEQAAAIKTIAFDKTGTLTEGKPEVTDTFSLNGDTDHVILMAASAEEYSEHHLASAILKEAAARNLILVKATDVNAIAGKGITAKVNGSVVTVGNKHLFNGQTESLGSDMISAISNAREHGKTVVYVSENESIIGAIALADKIRTQAIETLDELRNMGITNLVMLTGDSENVARNISEQLGINQYYAALLPEQKVEKIRELTESGTVAMVGDGVNDAPALATSHLGIAMGAAGTDVALETADVVLMGDDLSKLPYMIRLSRKARKVVWQNITFSLAVIAMLMGSVFLFDLPMTLGVIGHEGSTLIVVLNGLRLLKGVG